MDVSVWQWDKEQYIVIKNNGSQYKYIIIYPKEHSQ